MKSKITKISITNSTDSVDSAEFTSENGFKGILPYFWW